MADDRSISTAWISLSECTHAAILSSAGRESARAAEAAAATRRAAPQDLFCDDGQTEKIA